MKHSALISYHELSEEWQAEARSNNDEYAVSAFHDLTSQLVIGDRRHLN